MTNQLITPARALDRNGEPQPGAMAYVYISGTTTAQVVTNSVGVVLTWPVVADIDGVFPQMFYAGTLVLKVVLTDSTSAILPGGIIDPVAIPSATAATVSFAASANVPATDVQSAIQLVADALETSQGGTIAGAGLATGSGILPSDVTITVPAATNADAVAGTSEILAMTPATTKRAIKEWAWIQGYTSSAQTITTAGLLTLPHGLDRAPKQITMSLTCVTAEFGWSVGDVVFIGVNSSTAAISRANTVYVDDTNLYLRFSDDANCFVIGNKATGSPSALTNAKWSVTVGAF